VHGAQEGGERLVEEADHYAGHGEGQRIDHVSAPERGMGVTINTYCMLAHQATVVLQGQTELGSDPL
jgi:hypothetical protein